MNSEIESLLVELTSGDDDRAERAVHRLSEFGEDSLPVLNKLMRSSLSDDRWWAVRTLAQLGNPPMDLFIKASDDEDYEVRQCVALALNQHPHRSAIPSLKKLLAESDSITSKLAANALISIGNEVIPDLMDIFPTLQDVARIETIRAIAMIGDNRAIPVLMDALDEDSLMVNFWAEEGLNRLGLDMVYFKPE
jgi:HEAT repeat protein